MVISERYLLEGWTGFSCALLLVDNGKLCTTRNQAPAGQHSDYLMNDNYSLFLSVNYAIKADFDAPVEAPQTSLSKHFLM
jgi:hypothetical protein